MKFKYLKVGDTFEDDNFNKYIRANVGMSYNVRSGYKKMNAVRIEGQHSLGKKFHFDGNTEVCHVNWG